MENSSIFQKIDGKNAVTIKFDRPMIFMELESHWFIKMIRI